MRRATPWDKKWTRTFTYRSDEQAEVSVPQRLGVLTPYYAQVDVTRKYKWSSMYLTRAELGPEAVITGLGTLFGTIGPLCVAEAVQPFAYEPVTVIETEPLAPAVNVICAPFVLTIVPPLTDHW